MEKLDIIKETFHELSKTNKKITLQQVKDASGIDDIETELDWLIRKGIIMKVMDDDYRLV